VDVAAEIEGKNCRAKTLGVGHEDIRNASHPTTIYVYVADSALFWDFIVPQHAPVRFASLDDTCATTTTGGAKESEIL
jgi:hypothetical protein